MATPPTFTPKQALAPSPALMAELMGNVSVQVAHRYVSLADLKPGTVVLDNACGNRVVTRAIIESGALKPSEITIYAADINAKMCEATEKEVKTAATTDEWVNSVKTVVTPAEELKFDENFFSQS